MYRGEFDGLHQAQYLHLNPENGRVLVQFFCPVQRIKTIEWSHLK